jgi:hypothetical protein
MDDETQPEPQTETVVTEVELPEPDLPDPMVLETRSRNLEDIRTTDGTK